MASGSSVPAWPRLLGVEQPAHSADRLGRGHVQRLVEADPAARPDRPSCGGPSVSSSSVGDASQVARAPRDRSNSRFMRAASSKLSSWRNCRSGVNFRSISRPSRPRRNLRGAVQRVAPRARPRGPPARRRPERLDEDRWRAAGPGSSAPRVTVTRDARAGRDPGSPPRAGSRPGRGAPARRRAAGAGTGRLLARGAPLVMGTVFMADAHMDRPAASDARPGGAQEPSMPGRSQSRAVGIAISAQPARLEAGRCGLAGTAGERRMQVPSYSDRATVSTLKHSMTSPR